MCKLMIKNKVMKERSWGCFVQQPIPASLKVVSEFYAAMVPEVFENGGVVYVRGRQVHMTVKAINDYYKLDTDADHVDWEALNSKCITYGDALAYYSVLPSEQGAILSKKMESNLDRATYNALGRGQHDPEFVSRRRVRSRIDEDLMAGGHDPEAE
ncbi:hypothetical protein ACOSP7_013585 [Xanthoceras sorbifolium]